MTDNEYQPYPGSGDGANSDEKPAEVAHDKNVERLDKMSAKELGDLAIKFAQDTAYAAAGFADLITEKAREFADKQRTAAAESGETPSDQTKAFLEQVSAQMNKVIDDLGHAYKDLSERGRDAVTKLQQQAATRPTPKDAPGMFDITDDADTAEPHTTVEDPSQPEPGEVEEAVIVEVVDVEAAPEEPAEGDASAGEGKSKDSSS